MLWSARLIDNLAAWILRHLYRVANGLKKRLNLARTIDKGKPQSHTIPDGSNCGFLL